MSLRALSVAPLVAITLAWLAASGGAALADDANPSAEVPHGDPAMSAAFVRAAATLDDFLAEWRSPSPGADDFVVKIGLMDAPGEPGFVVVRPDSQRSGIVEWFWAGALRVDGDDFSARLSNEPDDLRNVAYGQLVHFKREDIGDWMYRRYGKIVGNATACPALAHLPAEEQRSFKAQYGIDCD